MIFVGTLLYGFCEGYFGRDSYRDKRIEAFGVDWIVTRDSYGDVKFVSFDSTEEMLGLVKKWSEKPDDYYGDDE